MYSCAQTVFVGVYLCMSVGVCYYLCICVFVFMYVWISADEYVCLSVWECM